LIPGSSDQVPLRHSGANWNPEKSTAWTPAFAGVTTCSEFSCGNDAAGKGQICFFSYHACAEEKINLFPFLKINLSPFLVPFPENKSVPFPVHGCIHGVEAENL
jgi:hypothetical protein